MDAMKFLKEKERMCKTCGSCFSCPAWLNSKCSVNNVRSDITPEQQINIVKTWVEQHPCKTRQSIFLEQYPNAKVDGRNVLCACPAKIYGDNVCLNDAACCSDCCRDFWSQEVE